MYKYILATILFFSVSANASFIEGLEDIPVMTGLIQIKNNSISFGNEESRLIEVYLTSKKIKFKQVEKFYIETLPQMGWTYQGKNNDVLVFYRESEAINIAAEKESPLVVRITVKNRI